MEKSKYPLKDSPISYLNSTQFLYTFFGNVHYRCKNHWQEYLELFDICREFYDLRRKENFKSLGFNSEDIRPSGEPLSFEKVQLGEELFGENYKRICTLVVDRFDACMLHEFDGYARQCLDMNTLDPDNKWYYLKACLHDRDIKVLNKALYQRSMKLLQDDVGMRKILYKDIQSYTNQCNILKHKYENCISNSQKDSCILEEFKYKSCVKFRDCKSEIDYCSKNISGSFNGDEDTSKWYCMEFGTSKILGSRLSNIDDLNRCLLHSEEKAML